MTEGKATPPRRALVVEDHVGHARFVRTLLEALEPPVEVHQSGRLEGACERLGDEVFDVIVADLHLPDGQGPTVVARLAEVASGAPIVVVSALDDEDARLEALRNGAHDWIVKDRLSVELLGHAIGLATQRAAVAAIVDAGVDIDVRTGALTRDGLRRAARRQVALSRRQGRPIAVVHLVVGNVAAGQMDELLRLAVKTARVSDLVARTAADRLCFVLPDDNSDPPIILGRLQARAAQAGLGGLEFSPAVVRFDAANPVEADELLAPAFAGRDTQRFGGEPPRRMLLASSDPALTEVVARALGENWRLLVAPGAPQALRIVALEEPDMALIDMALPSGTAANVARTVTEQPEAANIPVLGISAPDGDDAEARRQGFSRILQRSSLANDLADAIRSLVT